MMTAPANNDDGYLQFVVSLLDESDFARSRSGSLIPEDMKIDDFLPGQTEFMMRDRAFSWDLGFEEQLHADAQVVAEQLKSRKRSNSILEIKKAIEDAEMMRYSSCEHVNKRRDIKEEPNLPVPTSVESHAPQNMVSTMPPFVSSLPALITSDLEPVDSGNMRIGAYTKQERQAIIERFRAKKKRRVWRKQIKYDCRKRLADTRPRVKGRFVSRKEREAGGGGNSSDAESESTHNDGEGDVMGAYDDDSVDEVSST
jgi:hypothetical protein